jgi:hypothetical protein
LAGFDENAKVIESTETKLAWVNRRQGGGSKKLRILVPHARDHGCRAC